MARRPPRGKPGARPGGHGRPAPAPRPGRPAQPAREARPAGSAVPDAAEMAAVAPADAPAEAPAPPPAAAPARGPRGPENRGPENRGPENRGASTAAQMRRFIKSRPWVPMHELRRRFAIDGGDDDVVPVDVSGKRIFVGLPAREGQQLGELLRSGEIGYELSFDPVSPVVIGVYPMRPVSRG